MVAWQGGLVWLVVGWWGMVLGWYVARLVRWQIIEIGVSRCVCVSVCSLVENGDQLVKTFHLSPYMTIL